VARYLSTRVRAHTLLSPTPESLSAHLDSLPPSPTSTTLYLLSTTLPSLPSILSILQTRLPSSIGSFALTPPSSTSGPSLSLATFESPVRIFRSDLTGRKPAEVGKWQREKAGKEDLKGGVQGDMGEEMSRSGWAGMWRTEGQVEEIPKLRGVEWVFTDLG
jgi:hypothetical protein